MIEGLEVDEATRRIILAPTWGDDRSRREAEVVERLISSTPTSPRDARILHIFDMLYIDLGRTTRAERETNYGYRLLAKVNSYLARMDSNRPLHKELELAEIAPIRQMQMNRPRTARHIPDASFKTRAAALRKVAAAVLDGAAEAC